MPTSRLGTRAIRDAGFSLLELLLVVTLIVAATVLLAPSFSDGMKSLEMQGAARDLITRMRQARSEAVSKQQVFRIVFDDQPDQPAGYSITDDYGQPIRRFELPRGVRPQREPGDDRQELRVSFYPNGRSSGGAVALAGERGRRLEVEVDPVTGLARVKKPEDQSP